VRWSAVRLDSAPACGATLLGPRLRDMVESARAERRKRAGCGLPSVRGSPTDHLYRLGFGGELGPARSQGLGGNRPGPNGFFHRSWARCLSGSLGTATAIRTLAERRGPDGRPQARGVVNQGSPGPVRAGVCCVLDHSTDPAAITAISSGPLSARVRGPVRIPCSEPCAGRPL